MEFIEFVRVLVGFGREQHYNKPSMHHCKYKDTFMNFHYTATESSNEKKKYSTSPIYLYTLCFKD